MPRPRSIDDKDVLDAAAAAVGAVGIGDLTLADISARVGLSPATLLQRFGSKRGLLLALARHHVDELPRRLRAAAGAPRPAAALIDVLSELAGGIRTSAEFANHLGFLMLDLSDPDFQAVTGDYARAVEAAIAEVLDAGRAAGELRAGPAESAWLARVVHAAYNGALVTWGMTAEGLAADHVRGQLQHVLAHELTTTGDPAGH